MKTLTDHTILYDDECPLCRAYTARFVHTKMLDEHGRVAFSSMPENLASKIDREKACNEIALINRNTGNVIYGVESLFTIIANRFPTLKPLFTCSPFISLMKILYAFISYNRKVIMPGNLFEGTGKCIPTLHLGYRWSYIIFAWVVSSFILSRYTPLLSDFLPPGNDAREYIICAGQIIFQGITVSFIRRDRVIHYLGNMMTISLAGSLLLIPGLVFYHFNLIHNSFVFLGWFGFVVSLMFIEHVRRTSILDIPISGSISWVIYRLLILTSIFFLF